MFILFSLYSVKFIDTHLVLCWLFFLEMILYLYLLGSVWFHVIILLIIMEIIILLIFSLIRIIIIVSKISGRIIFLFITLRVAEARIGVSLLTIIVRRRGNDYIKISIFEIFTVCHAPSYFNEYFTVKHQQCFRCSDSLLF